MGHPLSEGRVPFRRVRGEGERSHRLSYATTPLARSKKRSKGALERDEFFRSVWRIKELGRIDAERLVFVDEMGTHTSLAPLYAYTPVGRRAFFEIPRNLKARTPRCLGAFTLEGWDHLWPWRGLPPPECVRDLHRALAGSRLKARSDRGYGQPGSAQAKEDKGAHRGARMRASFVSALILTRSEPHRGSPLEDKAYPPEDEERPHQGCADGGEGLGAGSCERPGRTRILCLLRLPNPGAAVMKRAVRSSRRDAWGRSTRT